MDHWFYVCLWFSKGVENTMESYIHLSTNVGSYNCTLWTKLGLLDSYHRTTNLHEQYFRISVGGGT